MAGLGALGGFRIVSKKWTDQCEDCSLEKNKTGSSQVGAIYKAQKYSRISSWKHLEKISSFRLIKRFYKPKTSKKCKGEPFDRIRKFSKKCRIVPKKTIQKKTDTLWSRIYFWKNKKISGFVRELNPRSPVFQKNS